MSTHRRFGMLLGILAGCSSGPGEPPNLPAPEYEPPRSYEADTAIDSAGGAEEEAVPDAPPPVDAGSGGAGEVPTEGETPAEPPAEGAGGGEPES